jgi:hypothetical protein
MTRHTALILGGARTPIATELRERQARYGPIGICVRSGQGVAVVLEHAGPRR